MLVYMLRDMSVPIEISDASFYQLEIYTKPRSKKTFYQHHQTLKIKYKVGAEKYNLVYFWCFNIQVLFINQFNCSCLSHFLSLKCIKWIQSFFTDLLLSIKLVKYNQVPMDLKDPCVTDYQVLLLISFEI